MLRDGSSRKSFTVPEILWGAEASAEANMQYASFMTRYLLYFLTGVAIATVILFFRGYVAVPHNIYSDVSLRAAMVLFGLASWVTLFRVRPGAVLAMACLLAVLPWLVRIGLRVWSPEAGLAILLLVRIIHVVLSVLVLAAGVVSVKYTFFFGSWREGTSTPGKVVKYILAAIPVLIVLGWLLVMRQL